MYRWRRFEAPRKFLLVTEVLWRDQGKKGKGKAREVAKACCGVKGLTQRGVCEVNGRGVNPRLRRSGEGRERERGEMMMLMMMFKLDWSKTSFRFA